MEHVNDWCFRDIYKGGLWDDDLHVCALNQKAINMIVVSENKLLILRYLCCIFTCN